MLSLNSSSKSSCLSFPHTYLFWLSQYIIEASSLLGSMCDAVAALFLKKFVFMSMCIHLNFMKTAVSLIASVLWPFLICNIALPKKDLAASLLGIYFISTHAGLVWLCSSCLSAEFKLPYLVNALVKYFHQVFYPILPGMPIFS